MAETLLTTCISANFFDMQNAFLDELDEYSYSTILIYSATYLWFTGLPMYIPYEVFQLLFVVPMYATVMILS